MPSIGLTGGIATGKSAIAAELRKLGAVVFSADQAAREVTAPGGPALQGIVDRFGAGMLHGDGTLDRAALAERVFADPDERRALEALTHPHILARLREQMDRALAADPGAVVVVEAPLLFEAGMAAWFDRVVVVAAHPETQLVRLNASRGMSETEARARIAAQMPLADKIAASDITIWNDDDADRLPDRARDILRAVGAGGESTPPRSREAKKGACTITDRVL